MDAISVAKIGFQAMSAASGVAGSLGSILRNFVFWPGPPMRIVPAHEAEQIFRDQGIRDDIHWGGNYLYVENPFKEYIDVIGIHTSGKLVVSSDYNHVGDFVMYKGWQNREDDFPLEPIRIHVDSGSLFPITGDSSASLWESGDIDVVWRNSKHCKRVAHRRFLISHIAY